MITCLGNGLERLSLVKLLSLCCSMFVSWKKIVLISVLVLFHIEYVFLFAVKCPDVGEQPVDVSL